MRTAIVTDSNSGIFEEEGKKLGVFVLPMPVIINGKTYYEGRDLSHEHFFRQLHEHKPISTSQPNIGTVLNIKPLLVIKGSRLDAYAKVRGTRCCQKRLLNVVQAQIGLLSKEGSAIKIGAAGSFADPEKAEEWKQMVKETFPDQTVKYDPLTFSIASHVGPDAFGMGISKAIKI